jgi:HEAT repeat protein
MPTPDDIPFRQMLDALLDEETPFHPRYLYRLSDLNSAELKELEATWDQVSSWRKQALMEDLEILGDNDYLLSFDAIARVGLKDLDPLVRTIAIQILWDYDDQDLAWIYLDMAESDVDPKVRAAAASALGKFVYLAEVEELPVDLEQEVEERLLQIAKGQDEILVRRRALEALGFSSIEEVSKLIQDAYDTGQKEWIASSLFAMGRSANENWRQQVLSKVINPHPSIRMEAARAAGELELSEATPNLLELLDDDNVDVRSAAIWSLSQIGGSGIRDVLEKMHAQTEDEEEAEFILTALDNLDFTEEMALFTLFDIDGSPKPVPEADVSHKPDLEDAFRLLDEDDLEEDDSYYPDDEDFEDEEIFNLDDDDLEAFEEDLD